jgi:hypothetical protein
MDPEAKHARMGADSPLSNAGILQHVLGYVGHCQWLYIGGVSQLWQECYLQLASVQKHHDLPHINLYAPAHCAACTCWRAVFESPDRLQLVQDLRRKKSPRLPQFSQYNYRVHSAAAKHGSIATLTAAHELGLPWTSDGVRGAAASGDLAKLQFMVEQHQTDLTRDFFGHYLRHAVRGGSVETLTWLVQRGCTLQADVTLDAASAGHLHVLRYLREHGCEWENGCCDAAARKGDLPMLRYFCTEGCPMDKSACEVAVAACKLEALKLLREHGCPWDASATAAAVDNNDATMLQYLYEQGCPWDATATTAAAASNNADMLQYLYGHGCSWDAAACTAAYATATRCTYVLTVVPGQLQLLLCALWRVVVCSWCLGYCSSLTLPLMLPAC